MVFVAFLAGVLATLAVQLYALYRWILKPLLFAPPPHAQSSSSEDTPATADQDAPVFRAPHHAWPLNLSSFLKSALSATHANNAAGGEAQVSWLNAIIHRYFVECRQSEVLRVRIRRTLLDKLSKRFRADGSSSLVVRLILSYNFAVAWCGCDGCGCG
jgi:hypothetical protein